ncbi:MAG TPA: protein kinase [Phycisphaerae bacterium]|nr:protein kinase [Phycisphaerae bacterium]
MARDSAHGSAGGGIGVPVGSKIGKYEVVERRAIGGQAVVYKCYDAALDRHVAVKQISTHLAEDPKFVERFRREAQILARLGAEQSAIVTIHELIEDERGLFIVMEFVQGHSLETILNDTGGPTEPKGALQIIWRLAAALHVVHSAGIIHRDIKPSNIIICEGLRPKITDFGVAASQSGQTSMLLGTTKYMAPELFVAGDVDGRADMYSLGMVAYEMLLGRPKFNEVFDEIVRDPHSEALRWMKWHSNKQVVAPELHEMNASIPKPLSDIVATMMAKDCEERFESMEALGRAIRVSFSPRARAAAGGAALAGAGARRDRMRRKAAAADARGSLADQDEGDELEVKSDSAPTATIPKKALSTRAKVIIAAGLFATAMAVVVGLAVKYKQEQDRISRAAQTAYAKAEALYEQHKYDKALDAFKDICAKYSDTRQGSQALVMVPLSNARLLSQTAQTAEQWDEVAAEGNAAREQAKKVLAARKDLENWARNIIRNIDDFEENRTRLKKFRTAMARVHEKFKQKKYVEALRIIDLELAIGDLTNEQKNQRDALRDQVARAEFDEKFNDEMSRGDSLASLDDFEKDLDFDAASAAFQQALKLVRSSSSLDETKRGKLGKDVEKKIALLHSKQKYREAIQEADSETNLDKKLAALRRADRIQPSAAIKDRINAVESDKRLARASDQFANGRFSEARREVDEALRLNPKNKAAQDLKGKIDKSVNRQQLLADGRKAFDERDYASALKKFLQAKDIASDDDLAARIEDCQYYLMVSEGDKFRDAKEYDKAIKAYEKARAIKPAAGPGIDARLAATKTLREYDELMAKGDQAVKSREFGKARGFFTQAKSKMETPEVVQRIAYAYYNENLELGKSAMSQRDYSGAIAYFKIAKRHLDAAKIKPIEVDGLILQAEAKLKETP